MTTTKDLKKTFNKISIIANCGKNIVAAAGIIYY